MIGNAYKIVTFLMGEDKEKLWDLKEHKEHRTLTQNAYYWALLGKTADKLRMSKPELHNRMLRFFGQPLYINGYIASVYLPDNDETEKKVYESERVHLRWTNATTHGKNGETLRGYALLRGSHEYNTKEMAILLDGMIQEAQQQGIETLTPRELAEMRANETKHHKNQ